MYLSFSENHEHPINNIVLEKRIDQLTHQLNQNRIFLNMVVHDMRNPTSSIQHGLEVTLQKLKEFDEKFRNIKQLLNMDKEGLNLNYEDAEPEQLEEGI